MTIINTLLMILRRASSANSHSLSLSLYIVGTLYAARAAKKSRASLKNRSRVPKNESPRVNSYPVFLCTSLPLSLVLSFYLSLFLPPFLTSLATIISLSALRGERHDLFVCLYHPVYMRHYVGCNKASPRCITRTCIIHVHVRDCVNRAETSPKETACKNF